MVALIVAIFVNYLLGARSFEQISVVFMSALLLLGLAVYAVSLLKDSGGSVAAIFLVSFGMFVLVFAIRSMIMRKYALLALLMFISFFIVWPSYPFGSLSNIPEIPLFLVLSIMTLVPLAIGALAGYALGALSVRVILKLHKPQVQPERDNFA